MWDAGIETRGLAHITGDGLANLCRLEADVDYRIDDLGEPQAIFSLIQQRGGIEDAEMHRVFNMGLGLVVVVPSDATDNALRTLGKAGYDARAGSVWSSRGKDACCWKGRA